MVAVCPQALSDYSLEDSFDPELDPDSPSVSRASRSQGAIAQCSCC